MADQEQADEEVSAAETAPDSSHHRMSAEMDPPPASTTIVTESCPADPMLGFLTLLAKVERPACANCELKDISPMFFCNTCGQAICSTCKEKTHSAKMFSRHDVTSVSPYSKEPQRKCPVHHEMCIMFSPANESLLCINCFRDLPPDIRAQCLDLDTAYQQKCERLQRGLKAVSELEVTIKDEAGAYRSFLKELQINAMREESTIHVFSKILQGVVTATEDRLIEAVKSELQSKEILFEEKLKTLESLQSNVQAYLTLSTAFISSASKFELLKLANGLVERLTDIGAVVQPTKMSPESSTISSNFKTAFSQSLKELFHQDLWNHQDQLLAMNNTVGHADAGKENSSCTLVETVQQRAKTPPLPFLGRSQSLVNIPIDLDHVEPKFSSNTSEKKPNRRAKRSKTEVIKVQSTLPRKVPLGQSPSTRSKSVETAVKTATAHHQQHQYHHDVSQVELFASIQSRQQRGGHNKNMTLTSALVGVRQKNGSTSDHQPTQSSVADKNAGHLCVVQAMVHQDADNLKGSADPARSRQRDREIVGDGSMNNNNSSIELTADQVSQLIRAISAAQQQTAASYVQHTPSVHQVPAERDVVKQSGSTRTGPLQRNDSFEGHEEAVRMLVDAVRDIKQFYTTGGQHHHNTT